MLLGIVLVVAGLIIFTAARAIGGPPGGNDSLAMAVVVIGVLFITACVHQLSEAEAIESDPPKRKQRWFQFSLRTLFLVTLFVASLTMIAKLLYDRCRFHEDQLPLAIHALQSLDRLRIASARYPQSHRVPKPSLAPAARAGG